MWDWGGCGERDEEWRPGADGARCSVRGSAAAASLAEWVVVSVPEPVAAAVVEGSIDGAAEGLRLGRFLSFPPSCIVCLAPRNRPSAERHGNSAGAGSLTMDRFAALPPRIKCPGVTSKSSSQGSRSQQQDETGTAAESKH